MSPSVLMQRQVPVVCGQTLEMPQAQFFVVNVPVIMRVSSFSTVGCRRCSSCIGVFVHKRLAILLVQFSTVVISVIVQWAGSCAQDLSAKRGDDDCLIVFAVGAGLAENSRANDRPKGIRSVGTIEENVAQDSGLVFSSRGTPTFSLRKRLTLICRSTCDTPWRKSANKS